MSLVCIKNTSENKFISPNIFRNGNTKHLKMKDNTLSTTNKKYFKSGKYYKRAKNTRGPKKIIKPYESFQEIINDGNRKNNIGISMLRKISRLNVVNITLNHINQNDVQNIQFVNENNDRLEDVYLEKNMSYIMKHNSLNSESVVEKLIENRNNLNPCYEKSITCSICMENEKQILCLPCLHCVSCFSCYYKQVLLKLKNNTDDIYPACPVCKKKILKYMSIHL